MLEHVVVPVDGPFSLAAAASFGFGPNNCRPDPGDDCLRLAFGGDDLKSYAGAVVRQEAKGVLTMDITDACDVTMAVNQISRIVSIDTSVSGWLAAGQAAPVLGVLQAARPGMRPVLFHSPYEAAAWSVLSQRRPRAHPLTLHPPLTEAPRPPFALPGQSLPP